MRQRRQAPPTAGGAAATPPPAQSCASSDFTSDTSSGSDSDADGRQRTGAPARGPPAADSGNGNNATAAGRTRQARQWLKKTLIPEFVHEHGRTVYGGNPLVQQTLPGIFNYPSPFILVPVFFLLMIPFLVVGALVLERGPHSRIIEHDYSQIHRYQYLPTDPSVNVNQGISSFVADGVTHTQGTRTWLEFNVTRRIRAPVYMYYRIDNMYQNYRAFHDGRSNPQLTGKKNLGNTYMCKPFTNPGFLEPGRNTSITITNAAGVVETWPANHFTYNPCGLAPWSMFNDTFVLYRAMTATEVAVAEAAGATVRRGGAAGTTPVQLVCNGTDFGPKGEPLGGSVEPNRCAKKGISWKADTTIRFHNMTLREDWWSRYYPQPTTNEYLRNGWYLHEPGHTLPDPSDYDLQVWVRASFMTNFRKLYRVVDVSLHPGTYLVDISEYYDVVSFRGRKSIVLQHTGWIGGRNVALGVVFVIMGCLSFVLGVAFTVECLLQRNGVNRYERMAEPRRGWYVFAPNDPEFANYYQLRLRRHVPMAQLQSLRKVVAELEGMAHASENGSLAQLQAPSHSHSDAEDGDRR